MAQDSQITGDRLDALEKRWREVNQRQNVAITRLLVNRQKVLDLMSDNSLIISETARQMVRSALNAEVSPEMIDIVMRTMKAEKGKVL